MAKDKILYNLISEYKKNNVEECFDYHIGCELHSFDYETQLQFKKDYVHALFKAKGFDICVDNVFASPSITEYRNKMEYSFGDEFKGGELNLGLHVSGRYFDIVSVHNSYIVDDDFNIIVREVEKLARELKLEKFNKKTSQGVLRNFVVRKSFYTGEILIGISTSSVKFDVDKIVKFLLNLKLDGEIVGIVHLKNDSIADVVKKGDEDLLLYGRDYYIEYILGYKFRVSFFSFFQTNTRGAELLYKRVLNLFDEISSKKVYNNPIAFDLFCGTGTITQLIASKIYKAVGVEIVEEAVEKAIENTELNKIDNCEFIAGDVFKVLQNISTKPDFIILDPPRSGVMIKSLEKIISYGVDNIIYVSCNPRTLAIDYEILNASGYKIKKLELVDLYPHTKHVECVTWLEKIK